MRLRGSAAQALRLSREVGEQPDHPKLPGVIETAVAQCLSEPGGDCRLFWGRDTTLAALRAARPPPPQPSPKALTPPRPLTPAQFLCLGQVGPRFRGGDSLRAVLLSFTTSLPLKPFNFRCISSSPRLSYF